MSTPLSTTASTTLDELMAAQINDVTATTTTTGEDLTTAQVHDVDSVALAIPTEPKAMCSHLMELNRNIIGRCAVQLKQDGRSSKPLNDEQNKTLTLLLRALSNIQGLTPAMEKSIGLKAALETVMDGMPRTAKYQFSAPFPEMAKAAYDKFEAENWGNNDEIRDEDDEQATTNDTSTATSSKTTTKAPKSSSPTLTTVIRRPHRDHPIYGTNGIMHGIMIDRGGKVMSYKIDDNYPHRSGKVFGNNGMVNGQWWPLQICALRDGAHGMRMGGIAGSPTYGAYSIIVSGMYADLDADYGDLLYYSGSQSHDNTNPTTPVISNATKALQRSLENGKVVRVLRTSGGDSNLCPSVGLRYDGLYQVKQQETRKNRRGGAYLRFRLERVVGQPPIDRARPTRAEKRDYECVRTYY
ncbi:MAG: hypothetical protein M1830_000200 [Pleopsidium flavum]|nr:MAG: hypothetical protein M1830_000200 [Pleopsidium flavum]